MAGLDIFYDISLYLWNEISDAKEPSEMLTKLVEDGNLGVKTLKDDLFAN